MRELRAEFFEQDFNYQLGQVQKYIVAAPDKAKTWFRYYELNPAKLQAQLNHPIRRGTAIQSKFDTVQRAFYGNFAQLNGNLVTPNDKAEDKTAYVKVEKSLEDTFLAMEELVSCVALGHSNGIFISGAAGSGKTYTVLAKMAELGLEEKTNFVMLKGFSTARGLFDAFQNNPDKLFIIDDMDSALEDKTALNLLKSVLDTYPVRRVTWNKADGCESFNFTGRIIFISNITDSKSNHFKAVMTRVLNVSVGNSREEIVARLIALMPKIAESLDDTARTEIKEFLSENINNFKNVSLRLLVHIVSLYKFDSIKWRKLALMIE